MQNQAQHIGHLLSIKEASRLTGVPAYTLRFWEKEFVDFLRPPRTEGGQRRYDDVSLEMVERIKHLVDEEKYSIAGARGVLAMERQQAEKRDDIATKLRNEEQLNLILDEIAAIVREKVVARLIREESKNLIGERVPGLKAGDIVESAAAAAQSRIAAAEAANREAPPMPAATRPAVQDGLPSVRPQFRVQEAAPMASDAPGSASNLPRVTIRNPIKTVTIPEIAEITENS